MQYIIFLDSDFEPSLPSQIAERKDDVSLENIEVFRMAGIFGPDNNKVWFDNFTVGQYIVDMEARLPYHAFNAYDQVNAATTIMRQEGLVLNTLKNSTAARIVSATQSFF